MIKPSPNEKSRLIAEERERRRLSRLQEVRQQERDNAKRTLRNLQKAKQLELERQIELAENDFMLEKEVKLAELYQELEKSNEKIGESHFEAQSQPDFDELVRHKIWNNRQVAKDRYENAVRSLNHQNREKFEIQNHHINCRVKSLRLENERSKRVISRKITQSSLNELLKSAKTLNNISDFKKVGFFSTTYYHLPNCYSERPVSVEQIDAVASAARKVQNSIRLAEEQEKKIVDNMERARLRGDAALDQELAKKNYTRMCRKLSEMAHEDQIRRSELTSTIPNKIFSTSTKRRNKKEEKSYGEIVLESNPRGNRPPEPEPEIPIPDFIRDEEKNKGDLSPKNNRLSELCPPMLQVVRTESNASTVDRISTNSRNRHRGGSVESDLEDETNRKSAHSEQSTESVDSINDDFEIPSECEKINEEIQHEVARLGRKHEKIDDSKISLTGPNEFVRTISEDVMDDCSSNLERWSKDYENIERSGYTCVDSDLVGLLEEIKRQKQLILERQRKHEQDLAELDFLDSSKLTPSLCSGDTNSISATSKETSLTECNSKDPESVEISNRSFSLSSICSQGSLGDTTLKSGDFNESSVDRLIESAENHKMSTSSEILSSGKESSTECHSTISSDEVIDKQTVDELVNYEDETYSESNENDRVNGGIKIGGRILHKRSDSVVSFERWENYFKNSNSTLMK